MSRFSAAEACKGGGRFAESLQLLAREVSRAKAGAKVLNFKFEEKHMQKKLIALAIAGLVSAPAFAQSNVTIYGLAEVYMGLGLPQ